jgi:hypothetical protein
MSRPSGTYCFPEQNIFLKDTRGFNTWRFYEEQTRDPIKAFAVKLTGIEDGKLMGNLYELDYRNTAFTSRMLRFLLNFAKSHLRMVRR